MKRKIYTFKKTIALFCVLVFCIGVLSSFAAAADTGVDYTITNPYQNVNWLTWHQYKADLHSHTTASDGSNTLKEQIEEHYKYGFDIYAVTDHGADSYSWTEQNPIPALKVALKIARSASCKIETLDANGGTAANGNTYTLTTKDGSDYYCQTSAGGAAGQSMMRVPYAIENNPTSLNNAHVNSFFVDYGNGVLGGTSDYYTPISNVDKLGGISVINHPGEYSGARQETSTAAAYNYSTAKYKYVIDKYAGLLEEFPSCIGIDINSKGDYRTRYDRKLWDILLQKVVPTGRSVFAVATSDSHNLGIVYSGYTEMCMPSNTVANLKTCMQNGAFFAASKYLGNPDEIAEIASDLENGNNTSKAMGDELLAMQQKDAKAIYNAPLDVDAPTVFGVAANNNADSITLLTSNALLVRWIANGKTIATGNTIDLDDYSSEIGNYVRAEIFGEGGIVYTQPFTLSYDGAPKQDSTSYHDYWQLASVVPDTIVRFIGGLPIFAVLWNVLKNSAK